MNEPILPQIQPITNPKIKDITGQRFGRLVALGYVGNILMGKKNAPFAGWLCRCDCGNTKVVIGSNLRLGYTQSCGCLQKERASNASRRHGQAHKDKSAEYKTWEGMISRCTNARTSGYPNYGGRGISVCDRWRNFEFFLEDMGTRPTPRHSLDRIDVNGNYEKSNCRWVTKETQANNTRTNVYLVHNGDTATIAQWSRRIGIKSGTIWYRLNHGWSVDAALTTPAQKHSSKKRS